MPELIRSVTNQNKTTAHVCKFQNHSVSYFHYIMDVIQKRFPTVAVNILNSLDDQSLFNYKESDKENCEFLGQERFYWIRILKKYNRYFETSKESWKKAISKTPACFIKKLAMAVVTIFKNESDQSWKFLFCLNQAQFTPVIVSAFDGDLDLFQLMNQKTYDSTQTQSMTSLIHLAAYRGDLAICKLLLNESENKNPSSRYDTKILHYAAKSGNLEVYQLFYNSPMVKNS